MNDDTRFDDSPEQGIDPDRRLALLADLTLEGLSHDERAELDRLGVTTADADTWRLAAAAAERALERETGDDLPDDLRLRVLADADAFFTRTADAAVSRLRLPVRVVPWLGWVVAAACLLLLVRPSRTILPPSPPSLEQRLASVAAIKLGATDHPLAVGAGGELVWSGERQEGFLKIRGLAEVEPSRGAYQLWIFDDTRDSRFPIDGGLFHISDAKGTTMVPIRPSLPVRRPTLFAVTLEPPGGVVVSDRKRLLLTASLAPSGG